MNDIIGKDYPVGNDKGKAFEEAIKECLAILEDDEELDSMVTLTDSDGNDVNFEFLDMVEYEGDSYAVLLPTDEEDATEVVILKVISDEDEESYVTVDDDDTLMAVFNIFKDKFKDEFNFVD